MNHSREAAMARFSNLLRLDRDRPGTAYGYELLATFQRSHGNPAAAIEAMMAALERRPGYQRYLDQTREIVNTMDPMAAAHLADELAAEPVDPPRLYVLAALRGRAGEGAVERKFLTELRHSPAYACQAEALSTRSLLRERQFAAAVAAAESARGRWPEDLETHFLLGLARMGVADCAGAIVELQTAARLGWVDDDIDFHRGFAHEQCGDATTGLTFYERYLERNPQGPYADMARRKMGKVR
jgi:tetratricopeptide (TPR) repeat protein